jgi:hypothetical protein
LLEPETLVEPDGRQVARPHFEECLVDAGCLGSLEQVFQQPASETHAAVLVAHADVEHVRFARAQAHDAIPDDLPGQVERAAGVTHSQAVAENVLAPRKRVALLLDGGDLGQVDLHHRADLYLRHLAQVFVPGRHHGFPFA